MAERRGPEGREGQPGREGAPGREGLPGADGITGTKGAKGEKGEIGKSISTEIKIVFLVLILIFFVVLLGFLWVVQDVRRISKESENLVKQNSVLALENKKRISEIQRSRIDSCKDTYSGIHKVFKPFFAQSPPADVKKFNLSITKLKQGCAKQTKPKKKGNK